jgi:predicted NAD/FAD-dependent oxidoreductase
MTALAKWLADRTRSHGATITTDVRVESVGAGTNEWLVTDTEGRTRPTDAVILTPPVPQTLDLLRIGGVTVDAPLDRQLDALSYKPTMALLVVLDGPSAVPRPGGVQRTERDLFTFIADNAMKGISDVSALTFHVNGPTSTRRWDDDPEEVRSDLLRTASPWFGGAKVVESQLKTWRYAGPYVPFPAPCVVAHVEPGPLVLAGDAFAGPKVEGAFNSGLAAAAEIASRLPAS